MVSSDVLTIFGSESLTRSTSSASLSLSSISSADCKMAAMSSALGAPQPKLSQTTKICVQPFLVPCNLRTRSSDVSKGSRILCSRHKPTGSQTSLSATTASGKQLSTIRIVSAQKIMFF
jgi:hypothetical protein